MHFNYISSALRITVNDELKETWKEAVVVYFKAPSRLSSRDTEKKHEKPYSGYPMHCLTFEHVTFWIKFRCVRATQLGLRKILSRNGERPGLDSNPDLLSTKHGCWQLHRDVRHLRTHTRIAIFIPLFLYVHFYEPHIISNTVKLFSYGLVQWISRWVWSLHRCFGRPKYRLLCGRWRNASYGGGFFPFSPSGFSIFAGILLSVHLYL